LEVYTSDATPIEWAMTSTNLANALAALAEYEAGSEHLEEAIAVYRQALSALDGPARIEQRAIARYNLKRAETRLSALRG
jgi:hypothetical protein